MASYKPDGGRIPRLKDVASQSRNAPLPVMTASARVSNSSGPLPSTQRIARPTNIKTTTSKGSSISDAEASHAVAPSKTSRIPSARNVRSLLPPRAATHLLSSVTRPNLPAPDIDRNTPLDAHAATSSSSLGADQKQPVRGRPRNVLRRRAPTIGQYNTDSTSTIEATKPEKLNVIIPDSTRLGQAMNETPQSSRSQTELMKENLSTYTPQDSIACRSSEEHVHYGPKELASLRTTINTQNLPPPTPIFVSASSPSTRYSGSPGVWSRTSRTSTPTSISSYSPGIFQPAKVAPCIRQPSPSQTRLPVWSRQVQQSPQSDSMHLRASRSPALSPESGMISSPKRQPEAQGHATKTSPTPNSGLPRKSIATFGHPRMPTAKTGAEPRHTIQGNSGAVQLPKSTEANAGGKYGSNHTQIPARPSREGTHQLQLEPSPVVQSNLSPDIVTGHKRRPSVEDSFTFERPRIGSIQSASTSVDSLQSRNSSQVAPLLQASLELSRKSPRALTRQIKLRQPPQNPVSPSKVRRFGLFTKKSKPDLETLSSEENRLVRKGPAAGTGHEGYGKYAQRGRRTSITSSGSRARSTSTVRSASRSNSSKGSMNSRPDLDLDDFLLERLEPVFINGGGMNGEMLARTQSEQSSSSLSTRSITSSNQKSNLSTTSGCSTESLTSSTDTIGKAGKVSQASNTKQKAPDALTAIHLSETRNIRDLKKPTPHLDASSLRPRPPIVTAEESRSGVTALPSTSKTIGSTSQQKKSPKKGLGLKWNFFQKHHDAGSVEGGPSVPPPPLVQATISAAAVRRPVAHYALVDTELDTLEDIIRNVEGSPPTEDEKTSPSVDIPAALNIRRPNQSVLLPSPPKLQGEFKPSTRVYFNRDQVPPSPQKPTESMEEQRSTRLASIGRIPRVVSRRDRQHRPALQSFSRPFSMANSPSVAAPVTDSGSEFSPPGLPTMEAQEAYHASPPKLGFDFTKPFGDPMSRSVLDFIAGPYSTNQFLSFSPRKDSTTTVSSSSGSESLTAVTAILPEPESALTEDEVWGEYDDLIDHVLSPDTARSIFLGNPEAEEKFELAAMASRALQAELNGISDRQVFPTTANNPAVALTPASPTPSDGSIHLKRSEIASALHSSLVPSSQPSFSDIIACYHYDESVGNINEESQDNLSAPVPSVEQQSSFLTSPSLNPSPSFETCRQRNTILFDIAERDREGPTAQTNIRSGSLMTSRWLSFGRVLFSPAHNHIKNGDEERILVVDGLGNDDWSFYCALTYPKAEVYSLNDGPAPTASRHPDAWQPPSNHHTILHASLEDRFPFPKRYFTVTVLRFPAACPEYVQDNIISECKRVLRPGGYMEMSVLDLDMVNMGIRTRKAVRSLKEKTYLSDPSISLKPCSDSIQRLLGRNGFDNLRRCMVRIPVAGMIVRSSASSSSTSSSNPSTLPTTTTSSTALSAPSNSSIGAQLKAHSKSSSNDTDLSLGDLLSDPSPSPSNDESIRKIVARVGRWWYTRCYEIPVLPNGDADLSIWADRRVLRECQKRGTGFRLLIAYAQKPSEKRRTASV